LLLRRGPFLMEAAMPRGDFKYFSMSDPRAIWHQSF